MFTGIVEELSKTRKIHREADSITLTIRTSIVLDDVHHGDSIAVDGVCLIVVEFSDDFFSTDLMQETPDRSSLGRVEVDSRVNFECATTVGQRLGDYIVWGHVDDTGKIISRTPGERWEVVRISPPEQLSKYVAEKGLTAVDGTLLTVPAADEGLFEISLIPATLTNSVIGSITVGAKVDLEIDVLTKYIERMLGR